MAALNDRIEGIVTKLNASITDLLREPGRAAC